VFLVNLFSFSVNIPMECWELPYISASALCTPVFICITCKKKESMRVGGRFCRIFNKGEAEGFVMKFLSCEATSNY